MKLLPENRPSARERGYDSRWDKARKTYLAHHPFCVPCARAGRAIQATHVDHIIPHRGDQTLFWDKKNWQGCCSTCHNGDKQRAEKSGKADYRGCDESGTPLDPAHFWRTRELDPNPASRNTAELMQTAVKAL